MQRTRVLGADRVALFGYAHVPHIVPRQRMIDASNLPGAQARFDMAAMGFGFFLTHGYMPVGFDHFAKAGVDPLATAAIDGTLRRNFQGFTDDPSEVLIGLGASAISSFPDRHARDGRSRAPTETLHRPRPGDSRPWMADDRPRWAALCADHRGALRYLQNAIGAAVQLGRLGLS